MDDSRHVEESILHSIRKNGFPGRAVRLPFKPVYKSCKENGTSLTEVLENLRAEGVYGWVKGDYVEFRGQDWQPNTQAGSGASGEGAQTNPLSLEEMAREAMKELSPEQIEEIKRRVDSMSEAEKQDLLKNFSKNF